MDTVKSAAFDWISTDIVCHVVPLQQLSFLCPSACEDCDNNWKYLLVHFVIHDHYCLPLSLERIHKLMMHCTLCIRLHRMHYIDLLQTLLVPRVICVFVCVEHTGEPCKNAWTDQDAVWGRTCVGLTNHVLDGNAHWHHMNTMKDPYAAAMWPYYFDH